MAAAVQPTDEDLDLFLQVARHCQDVLGGVQTQLAGLGYEGPTPRVKTTGTLVDKLRREHPMRLSQVQDLAGARVVVAGRFEQVAAVAAIINLLTSQGHRSKLSDRLARPMHGYRAMHILVCIDQVNVEIQVRTRLQDSWALVVEDLADIWGRGIRYGDEPVDATARIRVGDSTLSRSEALATLKMLSDNIFQFEENSVKLHELGGPIATAQLRFEVLSQEPALRDTLQLFAEASQERE